MSRAVNVDRCFEKFSDTFSPKIIGELNGQYVMIVRLEGDKVPWHAHAGEDEMFFVLAGVLEIIETEKKTTLQAGEFYIVPKGVEHRVVPRGHVRLMLFEPAGISHTGNVKSEITREKFDRLEW
ncbi:MAG: cupin domain-containing protein [Candidatus Krumholzibacteriota bacterium]|nr:cupin domain-containing protein [Candidatus Krumholzibacteriota bacterium]